VVECWSCWQKCQRVSPTQNPPIAKLSAAQPVAHDHTLNKMPVCCPVCRGVWSVHWCWVWCKNSCNAHHSESCYFTAAGKACWGHQSTRQRATFAGILVTVSEKLFSIEALYVWKCDMWTVDTVVLNNNNNNNNTRTMFMVLSSCLKQHCESYPGSRDECSTVPRGCRPLDQADRLEPQACL